MRQKVGIPMYRGREPAQEETASLSAARLALVQRYMIDAEEAEARAQSAVANTAPQVSPASPERMSPEAQRRRRAAEERLARAAAIEPVADGNGHRPAGPRVTQEPRDREELARADRQAAKQAARLIAAMEKKEARERKALAKAAAKREARERKALTRSAARP